MTFGLASKWTNGSPFLVKRREIPFEFEGYVRPTHGRRQQRNPFHPNVAGSVLNSFTLSVKAGPVSKVVLGNESSLPQKCPLKSKGTETQMPTIEYPLQNAQGEGGSAPEATEPQPQNPSSCPLDYTQQRETNWRQRLLESPFTTLIQTKGRPRHRKSEREI